MQIIFICLFVRLMVGNTMPTDQSQKKAVANRYPEEVATGGHTDRIDEICVEDIVEHGPMGELQGREQLKEASRRIQSAFSDLSVTVEDAVVEGDTVAQRLTFQGTHEGEFMGVPPTNSRVEIPNMAFNRIEDGQIAERWLLPDLFGLMQQLGVVDSPSS